MAVFTFDEAAHEYRLDGRRLPSVTQIIAPLSADWLRAIPRDVLEAKRAFGSAVHLACELDESAELDDEATDERVMRCVHAWRKFKADTGASVVMTEQRLYHPGMHFAGTLDRLLYLRSPGAQAGATWIIDLKTSAEAHASYGVQLAGYALLLRAGSDGLIDNLAGLRRGTVHLSDDGAYRLHEHRNYNDEAAFMACLALHNWKESTK